MCRDGLFTGPIPVTLDFGIAAGGAAVGISALAVVRVHTADREVFHRARLWSWIFADQIKRWRCRCGCASQQEQRGGEVARNDNVLIHAGVLWQLLLTCGLAGTVLVRHCGGL